MVQDLIRQQDPRLWQVLSLSTLSAIQIFSSDFGTELPVLATAIGSCLLWQWIWTLFTKVPFEHSWPSALISGFSLSLLLRSDFLWIYPVVAGIVVSSKFLLRINDKHLFNPVNIAIVIALLIVPGWVWVSPGQWGSVAWLAALMICLAALVLSSAKRLDIALGFLGFWALLLFGRAVWLGDPFTIPIHQLQNGALLIFTFFMITDPRTTPDHRIGRLIFAGIVAMIGFGLQFGAHIREGLFFALALVSLTTPLLDALMKAQTFEWRKSS